MKIQSGKATFIAIKSHLFLSLLFLSTFHLHAQKFENTDFRLNNGVKGKANFQINVSKGDTVFVDDFSFSSTQTDGEGGKGNVTYLGYKGKYVDGLKNGNWQFKQIQMRRNPEKNPSVNEENYSIVYESIGNETQIKGKFTRGFASGNWEGVRFNFFENQIQDTVLTAKAIFNTGYFYDQLEVLDQTEKTFVSGKFKSDGFLDDEWDFAFLENDSVGQVKMTFDEGILKSIQIDVNEEPFSEFIVNRYADQEKKEVSYRFFLPIIMLNYPEISRDIISSKILRSGLKILDDGISLLRGSEDNFLWEVTTGNEKINDPQVKMPYFPLSEEQKNKIESLDVIFDELQENLTEIRNDAVFSIARYNNKELALYYAEIGALRKNITKIDSVIDVILTPYIEFIDQKTQIEKLEKRLEKNIFLEFEFEDSLYYYPYSYPDFVVENEFPNNLEKYVSTVRDRTSEIMAKSDSILADLKIQNELVEKEQTLNDVVENVTSIFGDSTSNREYNRFQKRFGKGIILRVNKKLSNYARLSVEEKLESIDELIECISSYPDLYFEFNRMRERIQEVENLYTEEVFNPYTFIYQSSITYPRLFQAYENVLLPYVLNQLEDNLGCDEYPDKLKDIDTLINFMARSYNRNAKKLDRLVSRNDSADVLIKKLDIPINL